MEQWIAWVACLLFGHDTGSQDASIWRDVSVPLVCGRCQDDVRHAWMIQMDWYDRLEAMAVREIQKRRR